MLVEALRDRPIDRIHLQCKIRREHHRRLPLRPIVSVWRGGQCASGIRLRSVLLAAGRARRQLIIVLVEIVEEPVVPLRRFGGPGALQPARDRVVALAAAKTVLPAETLLLQTGALRFGTDVPDGGGGTVSLADRVAADDERNRLLVVHRHARERLSNVTRRKGRVRLAARALRIHVDQTHVIGAERPPHLPAIDVTLVSKPGVFGPPEDLVGLPPVLAPEAEAERLEAHRFI